MVSISWKNLERDIFNILGFVPSKQKKLSLLKVLGCNYYVNIYFKCHFFESLTLADFGIWHIC